MKPKLAFSCPENWDKMKIGLVARYCDNCKRDVQDFTTLTKEEILRFLWTNRNRTTCGRIFKSQLDYSHEELLIIIESAIRRNKNSNLSFYLLTIGTMMLLSCSTNGDNQRTQTADSLARVLDEQDATSEEKKLSSENQHCKIDSLLPDEFALVGEVVTDSLLNDDSANATVNGVRVLAEVMPEFMGGFDSLAVYIKENLKYPEWEKKAGIEGNVFVSFTVDEDGKIIDPKILKSVAGAKNFDREVLNLIKRMPAWKPGQERGENVPVQFTLPIRFKL